MSKFGELEDCIVMKVCLLHSSGVTFILFIPSYGVQEKIIFP